MSNDTNVELMLKRLLPDDHKELKRYLQRVHIKFVLKPLMTEQKKFCLSIAQHV